jgi:hypothetical protein
MEWTNRGPGAAIACGLAGPLLAMGVGWALAPVVLGHTIDLAPGADLVTTLGVTLASLFVAALVLLPAMAIAGVVATGVALVATRCPRPFLALGVVLVLTPFWFALVELWSSGFSVTLVALGVVPAGVRLVFGLLAQPVAT